MVTWEPDFEPEENRTYYWRVAKIPEAGENYKWNTATFVYIPGENGWQQSHYQQFENNNYYFLEYNNEFPENFSFIQTPKHLHCHNIGSPGQNDYFSIEYTIDGAGDYTSCCDKDAILVVVIDSLTIESWESDRGDYGQIDYPMCQSSYVDCDANRQRPDKYFVFRTDETSLVNMAQFLAETVPNGNYILVYSFKNGHFQSWPEIAYSVLESLGSNYIRDIPDNYPYIFFAKKASDDVESVEVIGSSANDVIDLNVDLYNNYFTGEMSSPLIGPAKSWEKASWLSYPLEQNSADSSNLTIIGVKPDKNEEIIYENIGEDQTEIDLSQVNAEEFPYMKLSFFTSDEVLQTPAQLDYWNVTYDPAGEMALNPSRGYYFYSDTLLQGEQAGFSTVFENITAIDFDSLLVRYWVQNKNSNFNLIEQKKLPPLEAESFIFDTIYFSTREMVDTNYLWIEANPVNEQTSTFDQLEQYHFNNLGNLKFFVKPDNTNPLLDVTFDGIHIMDGDIVSARPEILISLNDENPYFPLDDTSLFAIYIKPYESEVKRKVHFKDNQGNQILEFIPGEMPENVSKVYYRPEFDDGRYELHVQAKDKSNNESGRYDYKISFQIHFKVALFHITQNRLIMLFAALQRIFDFTPFREIQACTENILNCAVRTVQYGIKPVNISQLTGF